MPTTNDLLTISILQDTERFLHLLRRTEPSRCEFYITAVYKNLAAEEIYTYIETIPAGKVKLAIKLILTQELQREINFKWLRDGQLVLSDANFVDTTFEPPLFDRIWHPIQSSYTVIWENTNTGATNWIRGIGSYFLLDREVWSYIEDKLLKPIVKEAFKI